MVEGVRSSVQRLQQLVGEDPGGALYTHVPADGTEEVLTAADLDRRSSQLAGAMVAKGVSVGDRVALGLRNSPELVDRRLRRAGRSAPRRSRCGGTSRTGSWTQLREVIDASLHLGDDDLPWIRDTRRRRGARAPRRAGPADDGICSSGSTGTPKIIVSALPAVYNEVFSTPMMEQWRPVDAAPDRAGAGADVPRQRLRHAPQPARRRPPRRAGEVRRRSGVDAIETPPASPLHGDADDAPAHRRPPRRRRPRPVEHRLDPAGRGADAAVARPPVGRPDRRRADRHGVRHDRGHRHHRAARRRVAGARGQRRVAAIRGTEVRILDEDGDDAAAGRDRRDLHAVAVLRRVRLPR